MSALSVIWKKAETRRHSFRKNSRVRIALAGMFAAVVAAACSVPGAGTLSATGKGGAIDAANIALTSGNCAEAIDLIEDLYESDLSDDQVRFVRASAHACAMDLEFFQMLTQLGTVNLMPPFFWQSVSELLYNSSLTDTQLLSRENSGWFATDALMAILQQGVVVPSGLAINAETSNPGSVDVSHRTADSNFYMLFVSLALMSHTQNRHGAPDSANGYTKTQNLPWTTLADMDEEGCAYAGAILNFFDSVGAVASEIGGDMSESLLDSRSAFLGASIVPSCVLGCTGDDDADGIFEDAGCQALSLSCTGCPKALRNRDSCMASNEAKCAAAGLIRFVNATSPLGAIAGWQN